MESPIPAPLIKPKKIQTLAFMQKKKLRKILMH
jgi:hypothetical protein